MSVDRYIRQHWRRVRELGCIITDDPVCQIAHCHGGSISEVLGHTWRPGMAQRQNHWLVIPLRWDLHNGAGIGLDDHPLGVYHWELLHLDQISLLEQVSQRVGYDVFQRAGVERSPHDTAGPGQQ